MCVCLNILAGCECNVVIATCPQRDLESTFLRCDNVAFTTLPQPKHNVVTTLSQRDFVCWAQAFCPTYGPFAPCGRFAPLRPYTIFAWTFCPTPPGHLTLLLFLILFVSDPMFHSKDMRIIPAGGRPAPPYPLSLL